jgi:hypothetical protein
MREFGTGRLEIAKPTAEQREKKKLILKRDFLELEVSIELCWSELRTQKSELLLVQPITGPCVTGGPNGD